MTLTASDGTQSWQVPVAGVALFANVDSGQPRSITAFDSEGNVLAKDGSDHPAPTVLSPTASTVPGQSTPTTWGSDAQQAAGDAFSICLAPAGATFADGPLRPRLSDDPSTDNPSTDNPSTESANIDAVWNACIDRTLANMKAMPTKL